MIDSVLQVVAPLAYIGPGADIGLIASAIGLLLTLGSSAVFMVLYPFRSLLRRLRKQPEQAQVVTEDATVSS
jgi:hypothetical protein